MSDSIRSGMMFIAFGAVAMSHAIYSPEGELQWLRAFIGISSAAMACFWMLTGIRFIIREELERRDGE